MARTPANITLYFLTAFTVDGSDWYGYQGDAGSELDIHSEILEVPSSNAGGIATRLEKCRVASLTIPLLESPLSRLPTILGDNSAGTDLRIPSHTISVTGQDADGTSHTITGTAQFKREAKITYDRNKAAIIPLTMDFLEVNGVVVTLDGEPY